MSFLTVFLSFLSALPTYPRAIQTVVTDKVYMLLRIALLLFLIQMERETQSGDACTHYAVPRALTGPTGERVMERLPNSEADTPYPPPLIRCVRPGDLPPACLERGRSRTYRMMTCWDGPRYPAFNSYASPLRFFEKRSWPHPKRSPGSFAAAGLFYTGTDLCISLPYHIYSITILHLSLSSPYRTRR